MSVICRLYKLPLSGLTEGVKKEADIGTHSFDLKGVVSENRNKQNTVENLITLEILCYRVPYHMFTIRKTNIHIVFALKISKRQTKHKVTL